MSYEKRTIHRGPQVFLRECRALGIQFSVVNGRIVTDDVGGTLQAYIQQHEVQLINILKQETDDNGN